MCVIAEGERAGAATTQHQWCCDDTAGLDGDSVGAAAAACWGCMLNYSYYIYMLCMYINRVLRCREVSCKWDERRIFSIIS